jgi:ribonucleoside-diphosphate reductase alpha chain
MNNQNKSAGEAKRGASGSNIQPPALEQPTPNSAPSTLRLSAHALAVLEKRFLLRDERGQLIEDPTGLFRRVARTIARVDELYHDFQPENSEEIFFNLMTSLKFLPNSPTLMNAGTPRGQLAGCFVLPVEDSMESIYGTLRDVALIQKSGGGTGFSFSNLRPRGDYIRSTRGLSSGPVSFMRLYDYSTQINRLGGTRAGANMGILRHDHPDIHEFVSAKKDPESLTSFNISVMATDEFMRAVERGEDIPLRFSLASGPSSGSTPDSARGKTNARALFEEIVANAWETGDPGLLFYDRINAANPTPQLGTIEATNPCGEQPLLPYESCNLGSINVSRFARAGAIDYDELGGVVAHAVHFLDNVLDANCYPVETIRAVTLGNRKIGLGVMGFADLLVELRVPYASNVAVALAEELMSFIQDKAKIASENLAARRGPFPNFGRSRLSAQNNPPLRNACVTSIAPTGTISLLADCSSGIEPFFALSYRREVIGTTKTIDVHPALIRLLHPEVAHAEPVLKYVRENGRLDSTLAPSWLCELFTTAHEIPPEWHVKMQAAFQRHTDTSVSKTINLVNSVTPEDVAAAYQLAFETGCKGVTVFRDGCKARQVLRVGVDSQRCPECGEPLVMQGGCRNCASCGYSICTI